MPKREIRPANGPRPARVDLTGRARAFVPHVLRGFKFAAVFQVRSHAGGAEDVVPIWARMSAAFARRTLHDSCHASGTVGRVPLGEDCGGL
jgi:hypothetical protein